MDPTLLAELIRDTPALAELADAGDVAGVLAAVTAPVTEVRRDPGDLIGPVRLGQLLPRETAEAGAAAFKLAASISALDELRMQVFCNDGFDFGNSELRAEIVALQQKGLLTAEQATEVLALGIWTQSLAEDKAGRHTTVSEAEVVTAIAIRARMVVEAHVTDAGNTARNAVHSGDATDLATIVGIFEARLSVLLAPPGGA